jgi:RNA recognition motif-containing protein
LISFAAVDREKAATEAAKRSQKENRVYVGNLSFKVKWNDLKDFMRDGGSAGSGLNMGLVS